MVGANGGVCSFAVQLAAHAGAIVIAPGLPEDEDYLRDLGESELLERDADIAALVREEYPNGIDALLDLASYTPEDFNAYAAALKPGGRGASPNSAAGDEPGRTNVMAVPSPENLERLSQLLDASNLRVPIQSTYGLDQVGGPASVGHRAHPGHVRHPGDLARCVQVERRCGSLGTLLRHAGRGACRGRPALSPSHRSSKVRRATQAEAVRATCFISASNSRAGVISRYSQSVTASRLWPGGQ